MAGRPRYRGTVVHGNGRGTSLGFPTANLALDGEAPADGVYSAWVWIEARGWHGATVSVGNNPTFKNVDTRRMECHVHDLHQDLYGKRVEVEIVAFLREMIAFSSAEELIDRTAEDVVISRDILEKTPLPEESTRKVNSG